MSLIKKSEKNAKSKLGHMYGEKVQNSNEAYYQIN